MKKYLLTLLTLFALSSCEQDTEIIGVDANKEATKFDVCHYSPDTDSWHVINIAEISYLKAHIDHGDYKLIDADNDGWVTYENECVPGGDCDDNNASIHPEAIEVCDGLDNDCDGIVDEGCNQNGFADYSFETTLPNFYKGTFNIITDFDCNSSLTTDGQTVFISDNSGGSSLISNSLAMNILNLLGYNLYLTSDAIIYDNPSGKMLDMLVSSENFNFGVDISRAVSYPLGSFYSSTQATSLLESKLLDIEQAKVNISSLNPIDSSLLFIFAYNSQHSDAVSSAWNSLDPAIKSNVSLILMVTEGLDEFIYDSSINIGSEEICDGFDNDCDGEVDEDCNQNNFADFSIGTYLPFILQGTYNIKTEFDYSYLTTDGQIVYDDYNSGGSSQIPNSLAMNVLNLMGYDLYKASGEIIYKDPSGKEMNILVLSGDSNFGVIISRAFSFPPGSFYLLSQATSFLESKLSDVRQAKENISNLNQIESSLLFVFAYDSQHANVISEAWNGLDSTIKLDVTLILITTDGSDGFIYGVQ